MTSKPNPPDDRETVTRVLGDLYALCDDERDEPTMRAIDRVLAKLQTFDWVGTAKEDRRA